MSSTGCAVRPICHRRNCSEPADVMLADKPRPDAWWFPHCDAHGSDRSDRFHIRRLDEDPPDVTVYGRPGSRTHKGMVMHVETPDGVDVLCHHFGSNVRRYNLSHTLKEGAYICGTCKSTSAWAEDYSDDEVAAFLVELRRILRREDGLRSSADTYIRYSQPEPERNHGLAEGVVR